jgi:glutathione peroxidase
MLAKRNASGLSLSAITRCAELGYERCPHLELAARLAPRCTSARLLFTDIQELTMADSIYEFQADRIGGTQTSLADYKGKVVLIVNTASKCGFTPQFEGLESLHKKFEGKGLAILGFPCNQFGHQDPGSNGEIETFCQKNYGVSFPMFAKVDVNGDKAHPLYQYLKAEAPGLLGSKSIKWNFTKFLVDKTGKVVKRYPPLTKPEDIESDLAALL